MLELAVQPIVEGHGEETAVPILVARIWKELLGGTSIEVRPPFRQPRGKLVKPAELSRALAFASLKLRQVARAKKRLALLLIDADDDLPCELGPALLREAQKNSKEPVSVVLANVEYETWFVAGAESLREFIKPSKNPIEEVEPGRLGKGWIERHFRGASYTETADQARMTAKLDLALARRRSPSFDKLCRELERQRSD